jgi:hypothetical protein
MNARLAKVLAPAAKVRTLFSITEPLTQGTAIALIASALLTLLILKPLQVHFEGVWHGASVLSDGIKRRLDDPSFWAVFASLLAAAFVRIATSLVIGRAHSNAPPVYYVAWAATALAGLAVYTFSGYINHEAWFDRSCQLAVHRVQLLEGFVNAVVIVIEPLFLSSGLICLEAIRSRLLAMNVKTRLGTPQQKDEEARRASGLIASAGAGPFISAFLAWSCWQLIKQILREHAEPSVFGTSKPVVVIAVQALAATPFLVLLLLVCLQLRNCIKLTWKDVSIPKPLDNLLVIWIGRILLLGYFRAEWLTPDGCRR